MAYDNTMAERVATLLNGPDEVIQKHMFGSLGFMVDGALRVCVQDTSVMFKLPSTEKASELVEKHGAERVALAGRPTKNWVRISNESLAGDAALERYIRMCI